MSGPPPNSLWRGNNFIESTWAHVAAHARFAGICPVCARRVYHLVEGYCDQCHQLGYKDGTGEA